jgi:hypothetical protein
MWGEAFQKMETVIGLLGQGAKPAPPGFLR